MFGPSKERWIFDIYDLPFAIVSCINNEETWITMNNGITKQPPTGHDSPFERIKRSNDAGNEYWSSRNLSQILGYSDYRNFEQVVKKAKAACFNSGHRIEDHFVDITEMIEIGKGGQRSVHSVYLSRYACYLIVQNADPSKEIVALGQTYFAIQTRKQEVSEQEVEEKRRLLLRQEMKVHNVRLAGAAKEAGVVKASDYAIFKITGTRASTAA